jgi:hypothetical protein
LRNSGRVLLGCCSCGAVLVIFFWLIQWSEEESFLVIVEVRVLLASSRIAGELDRCSSVKQSIALPLTHVDSIPRESSR